MGENSKIEWTHHTFNPWRGCTKVSPGCAHCYAETLSHRNPATLGVWGDKGTRVVAAESYWRQPLKWDREARAAGERRRVFCASLADVFEDRPDLVAPRVRLFHLINETPNLDWLLLTKRPENVRRFQGGAGVPRSWAESMPPNVWIGTSVEDQERADERIPHLLAIPAAVRFLSIEPLLGPVDLRRIPNLSPDRCRYFDDVESLTLNGKVYPSRRVHWVIVGGESGPKSRPMDRAWVLAIRDQCRAAGVPFFFKQMTKKAPIPDDLLVREFPRTETV
jgi:protein gp37